MANKISVSTNNPTKYVTPTSRYINSTVLYYGDKNNITFSTYKRSENYDNSSDKFTVIPAGMEYRPDLISKKAYGVPDFWWKIMEANNIKDIFDFKSGLTIRIPNAFF